MYQDTVMPAQPGGSWCYVPCILSVLHCALHAIGSCYVMLQQVQLFDHLAHICVLSGLLQGRAPLITDLWEDPVPWGQMAVTALKVCTACLCIRWRCGFDDNMLSLLDCRAPADLDAGAFGWLWSLVPKDGKLH